MILVVRFVFFSVLFFNFNTFASSEKIENHFETFFNKIFKSKNITLNEAKRIRILANAHLSDLNERSSQSEIVETHKLLMLLVELEQLFPKEANYFSTKQLLTRYYNIPFKVLNQDAENYFVKEIKKTQDSVKAIDFLNRYLLRLNKINNIELTGFAISMKCDLIAQLFITSEYEQCIQDLEEVTIQNFDLLEDQKLNLLKYYYSTSALLIPKASQLIKQIYKFKKIKNSSSAKLIYQNVHELLVISSDLNKWSDALSKSNAINALDFTSNPIVNYNSKRHRAILLLKNNDNTQALNEAKSAIDLSQSTPETKDSTDVYFNTRLLELFFHNLKISKSNLPKDFFQMRLFSAKPTCTQNLLHNTQMAILLHTANHKGDWIDKIKNTVQSCEKYVGLKNQEPHINVIFEIAQIASQNELNKNMALTIEKKYNSIKNHFYSINYFDLIIAELLKKP